MLFRIEKAVNKHKIAIFETIASKHELKEPVRSDFIKLSRLYLGIEIWEKLAQVCVVMLGIGLIDILLWIIFNTLFPDLIGFKMQIWAREVPYILVGMCFSYALALFLYLYTIFFTQFNLESDVDFEEEVKVIEKSLMPLIDEYSKISSSS